MWCREHKIYKYCVDKSNGILTNIGWRELWLCLLLLLSPSHYMIDFFMTIVSEKWFHYMIDFFTTNVKEK